MNVQPRSRSLFVGLSLLCALSMGAVSWPFTCGSSANASPDAGEGRYVFTAAMLRARGVVRLSDLLLLVPGWDITTVDGVTWQSSPLGLRPPDIPQWQVLLDGHGVPLNDLGTLHLDRLPVALGDIDSVEVITLPRYVGSRFAGSGLIHVHTHRPRARFHLSGTLAAGNETGDPGPYQFTELATPNVERVGPDAAARFSVDRHSWFLQASYGTTNDRALDAQTSTRNQAIMDGALASLDLDRLFVEAGTNAAGANHAAFFAYSHYEDLMFFKPYGQEVPTGHRLAQAGIRGAWRTSDTTSTSTSGWGIAYRMSYAWTALDERSNAARLDFDWDRRVADAALSVNGDRSHWQWQVAVGWRAVDPRTATRRAGVQAIDRVSAGRASATVRRRLLPGLSAQAGIGATLADRNASPNATVSLLWRAARHQRVWLQSAYWETPPENDGRIWYWDERGYAFLDEAAIDVTRDRRLGTAQSVATDIRWALAPVPRWQVQLGGYHRGVSGLQTERQRFQFESSVRPFRSPVVLASDGSGQIAGAMVGVSATSRVGFDVTYRYQRVVAGDRDFHEAWSGVSRHVVTGTAGCELVPRLWLHGTLRYWSDTTWPAYAAVSARTEGRYPDRLDDQLRIDLALRKRLWGNRATGMIAFRNLLDRKIHYHPAGEVFALTVFAHVELSLGGPPTR